MIDYQAKDEYYEPDPNTVDKCLCGICSEEMAVERNRKPSGGFAGAMAGHNRYYDSFWCKNKDKKWHMQVRALKREIAKTASKKLADMLQLEANEILITKTDTKQAGYG